MFFFHDHRHNNHEIYWFIPIDMIKVYRILSQINSTLLDEQFEFNRIVSILRPDTTLNIDLHIFYWEKENTQNSKIELWNTHSSPLLSTQLIKQACVCSCHTDLLWSFLNCRATSGSVQSSSLLQGKKKPRKPRRGRIVIEPAFFLSSSETPSHEIHIVCWMRIEEIRVFKFLPIKIRSSWLPRF